MMETVEVTDHRNGQDLITNVPVQIVSEARVEVISKMAPVTVNALMPTQDIMTAQYINLHRMPEHLNKVLVTDPISGELLAHHVDLSGADFGQHTVAAQYYDTEELLAHGLTEDERRLAAELVAVQLKQQQQQGTTILTTQDLLNAKTLTSLGTVSIDKPTLSAAIVTGYIHTVDDAVQQQLLQQHDSQERCIMKIYPTQSGAQELQVLSRPQSQPLPPLKKVLSSQSMMIRNKFAESPGIMVELQNSELLDASQVPNDCIKPEDLDDTTQVVMTTAASTTSTTTSVPPPRPAAPPATPANVADELDSEDYEAENDTARAASRKSLPHKKRFPRKLKAPPAARSGAQKTYKCSKCGESFQSQPLLAAHRLVHAAPNAKRPANAAAFNCELCQKQFATQLKFFEHLKQHYEPANSGAVVGAGDSVVAGVVVNSGGNSHQQLPIESVGQDMGQMVDERRVMGGEVGGGLMHGATATLHATTIQDPMIVKSERAAEQQQQQNSVKVEVVTSSVAGGAGGLSCTHCGKTFRRHKALETHISVAHPSQEEIEEFSEPEDMMEGIRHVVNIPTVDSGDEEHMEEKLRWRYQLNATAANYSSIQEMGGMDLQHIQTLEAAQPLPPEVGAEEEEEEEGGEVEEEEGVAVAEQVEKGKVMSAAGGGAVVGKRTPPLMCVECNRVFNHRNSLLYHLRSHSGLRPHQCEVCGKGFISGSALKVHMRLHSGDKPYKCEHCSRHFRQWGDLKYHVTSLHSDQKQFQCEYCGKDFARKYSLNVHRRIHTGEKNYKCEFCGKTFRASSYLKNHRRIHTGEKPHGCDICGKPFRVRSDMKRHRRTHTKDQPTVEMLHDGGGGGGSDEGGGEQQHHLIDDEDHEESSETILPDHAPTPLNLNIRQGDADELVYTTTTASGGRTTHSVDSRDGTLYVWIPAAPDSILSDE